MQRILKRLSYANVMSTMAMFLVLGGATAFAATSLGKNSVGSKQLKSNAVTASKLGKGAVTATKIKPEAVGGAALATGSVTGSKIAPGAITGDKIAPGAVSADKIAPGTLPSSALGANSVGNAQTQLVKVFKGGPVPAAESRESAPRITLGSVGPFAFYGKCFRENTRIREVTYIELTRGVATLGSEDGAVFENDSEGYLSSATPEEHREMEQAEASPNSFNAESDDEEFQASASDGTEITGLVGGTGAKQGNPPSGNGPFLTGDSCIVGTVAIFGA